MNKQEVIKEINNLPKYYVHGACVEFEKVSEFINQLDEPEKVTIPKFVADVINLYKISDYPLNKLLEFTNSMEYNQWIAPNKK